MKISKNMTCGWVASAMTIGLASAHVNADTIVMEKQNTGFSIDGNRGSSGDGEQIYLFESNQNNVNQQWTEHDRGNGYYSYQKIGTSLCIDGGNGGANEQSVILYLCDISNLNQHWLKVSTGGSSYRLEKRNASGFSIDGKGGAENFQGLHLWESNSNNVNQQWEFTVTETSVEEPSERSEWTLDASNNQTDLSNALDGSTTTRWTTEEAQNNNQWLTIDLSRESIFNTITLNSDSSPNDYPRGYAVYISNDGSNWGSAIATGNNSNSTTEIVFDDVTASHIRIEQTGSADRNWWSIHDLSVSLEDDTQPPTSDWNTSSLKELHDAVQLSNQDIVMQPGNYSIADLDEDEQFFLVSGNNNTIDLTDVYIEFPVHLAASIAHFRFTGEGNTLIGGTIENTYSNGILDVTDFVSYNLDRTFQANGGKPHMVIAGNDTTILNTKMTVRGSFPYGYGSYFGIGGNNTFGLDKRGGIQINSTNTILDGVELYMEAFSHGIYIGPGEGAVSDNTIIRNTLVEGIIRPTNDMLAEGAGGLMDLNNYLDNDGNAIPANDAESLSEDGIRTYPDAGSVYVENSVVKGMRGGMRLYNASVATVTNSISIDNRLSNFQMSRDGEVTSSSANFTYGPALWVSNFKQNQEIDLTLLPSPNAIGEHNIADIEREGNTIVFRRSSGPEDSDEDRVIRVASDNSNITNHTEYTIELESGTSGNTIISAGRVIDNGSNNVTYIDLEL